MPLLHRETEVFPDNLFERPFDDAPWLVAHVRSRQEKVLARHLERKFVPFFLPQLEKMTKRSGRTFRSFVPLFPGYVFLRAVPGASEAAWRSNVVANLIDVADQDLLDAELRQIRQLQISGMSLTPHLEVVVGTPVRVTEGIFAGYTGIVMKVKDQERLIVTISHLQRAVAVELSRQSVDPSAAR